MSDKQKIVVVRVGRNNNILYSEYMRAKTDALTRRQLVVLVSDILKENEGVPIISLAKKIIRTLIREGGIDERYI